MKTKLDPFVLAVCVVIVLAYFFPFIGSSTSILPLDTISTFGIFFIFFFYGLKLSPEKLKSGLSNWKLHLVIQLSTFLLFPLIVIAFLPLVNTPEHKEMWLGMLYLAALPSTVSSSVVMVSMAKGNIPGAIFNASISGIIGIMVTPLWIGMFLKNIGNEFDYSQIYLKLFLGIIAPVILGIILQKYGNAFATKYAKQLALFDKSIILIIIFKSFCESFENQIFNFLKILDLSLLFVYVIALFFMVLWITKKIAIVLKFNREDIITAQYCGTKKSLVHGSVFYKILFSNSPISGMILLPLMVFHAFQILVVSYLASKEERLKS